MASRRIRRAVRDAKIILQSKAPVLSGNLQQNSFQVINVPRGSVIGVNDFIAGYGWLLDTGKVRGQKKPHTGWFSVDGYNAVAIHIEATNNGRRTNLRSCKQVVNNNSKETIARQTTYLRNIQRGDVYGKYEE